MTTKIKQCQFIHLIHVSPLFISNLSALSLLQTITAYNVENPKLGLLFGFIPVLYETGSIFQQIITVVLCFSPLST